MPSPPWKVTTGLDPVIDAWLASGSVRPCLAADRALASSTGRSAEAPAWLSPALRLALGRRGITQLYDHQVSAIEAARAGQSVVIATPTASGKSLCFHLPVLDAIAREPDASALYLYPTKALSRDQEAGLRGLIKDAELPIGAIVYDGDTPGDARRAARERARVIMTNPDMLHAGILPHHAQWARVFQRLRYVVLDELHTYRGVFGSHVAHVIARLVRVARFHGADPTFLCATATIGNPREHAARIIGKAEDAIALIADSGAPRGERRILLYNPPVVNAELGVRGSYVKSAVRLACDLIRARVPTIVFGPSRNSVEMMLKYLRDRLAGSPELVSGIVAYRGGYLPETRRRVEQGLRDGQVLCVVATNALELGIDIGDLDAVICAGYPGSVAETWQRFGRAGRRGDKSVAVLITKSAPIDQYLAHQPAHLLDGAIEQARIDPQNTEILIQHLKCAAFELPFAAGEAYAQLPAEDTREALGFLEQKGVLHESAGRYHWATDAYPASHVSLRSIGWDNVIIIDDEHHKTLAELDFRSAHTMLHEQAIYQHDGEQYQVERFDYENHKAYVRKVEPDYFTTAMTNRKVTVIDETSRSPLGRALATWGEVSVIEKVTGYKKVKFHTHENAGYGEVRLPDLQLHTTSFWLTVPEALCDELGLGRAAAIDALRGIGLALETVSTLSLMCDPRDLGQTLGDDEGSGRVEPGYDPTIFLFDNLPGGVGLAERIYEQAADLLYAAGGLIDACPCQQGCPLCVGPMSGPGATRKEAAARLARIILGVH